MTRIIAVPLKRVGEIAFGMSPADVRETVGLPFTSFMKTPASACPTDDFGSFHVYYNADEACEAVEIFSEIEVEVSGKLVFPTSLESALEALPSLVPDGDGLISTEASVGIYAPDGVMESILFGVKDYYS
ncbi:MAG TPA: hypothetical protein H9801_01610 [Candidatus Collinsella stercoripullorum]|nr:hypothetical protein [Candidatus Collinsella stercoripullorum]